MTREESETGEMTERNKKRQREADLTEFVFTSCLWVLWQRKSVESVREIDEYP